MSLSVQGLSKAYSAAGARALDDFSLEFPTDQCTVLLGPSGCGKTTVLRSIAGLITPDAGRITIDSSVVFDAAAGTDVPPEKRRLGMVFQSYALWPHLSVEKTVAFGLEERKIDKAEIKKRVGEALDLVHLAGMGERGIDQLSGGQQQRVAIARALVGRPTVMFADEPTGNLDSTTGGEILDLLRDSVTSLGQTTVMVTHDAHAAAIADRVLFLADGLIVAARRPASAYRYAMLPGREGSRPSASRAPGWKLPSISSGMASGASPRHRSTTPSIQVRFTRSRPSPSIKYTPAISDSSPPSSENAGTVNASPCARSIRPFPL